MLVNRINNFVYFLEIKFYVFLVFLKTRFSISGLLEKSKEGVPESSFKKTGKTVPVVSAMFMWFLWGGESVKEIVHESEFINYK